MLQWNDGNWEHRAYWGGNQIDWGQDGSASRKHRGDLPAAGQWVRLEVPAADVGLKPGAKDQWLGVHPVRRHGLLGQGGHCSSRRISYGSLAAWDKDQQATGGQTLPQPIQDVIKVQADKRSEGQQKQLLAYFLENVYAPMRETFQGLQDDDQEGRAADCEYRE